MAIQIPDAGTGNGATGDNEFVLWTKVINNFSDQTNAASRLLGTAAEQVPLSKDIPSLLGTAATRDVGSSSGNVLSYGAFGIGLYVGVQPHFSRYTTTDSNDAAGTPTFQMCFTAGWDNSQLGQVLIGLNTNQIGFRKRAATGKWGTYFGIYHTGNTTKDANGFLKGASPIVKVFADKVELNDDAEQQNVSYIKNGTGDYTITTVSGLSTDGWYIELPKDMNGNPKVAVTLSEVDGVISLRTYKRIFSMETFTFEPDLDNPLDIPDGRWIDLRLNEIPVEAQEELPTDGG